MKHSWQQFKSLYGARQPLRAFVAICMLILIASCSDNNGVCYAPDEFGDNLNETITVPANKTLVNTGINVSAGLPLDINVAGLVDLCPSATILGPSENNKRTPGLPPINASSELWQNSGISVKKGDPLTITVSGKYQDRRDLQKSGRGLYVYITENDPNSGDSASDWWYGKLAAEGSYVERSYALANNGLNDAFFEMYDNGTVGAGGAGYVGKAPVDGNIWFKYARTAQRENNDQGMENYGIDRIKHGSGASNESHLYSPWRGYYAWDTDSGNIFSTSCKTCTTGGIALSCAGLGPFVPLCTIGKVADCSAKGRLEEGLLGLTAKGKNCREPLDDHWVNDAYVQDANKTLDYDPARAHADNSGGYQIMLSSGCLGTFGRFLEMHIGESEVTLVKQTKPNGCEVGSANPDCEYVKDEWSEKILTTPIYTLGNANITNMDVRCRDDSGDVINNCPEPPYTAKGKYSGTVPSSGELWFRIKDDIPSPRNPNGYYPDNIGSYTVNVVTEKVDTGFLDGLSNIIKPIKGIIHGYCRISDNPDTKEVNEAKQGRYTLTEDECGDGWMPGITQNLYNKLVGGVVDPETGAISGNPFLNAIRAALVLFVIIYAAMFMVGIAPINQTLFLYKVLKASIVVVLLSPGSWDFFYNYLFTFFINGVDSFIAILSSEFSGSISKVLIDPITGEALKDAQGNIISATGSANLFAFAEVTLSQMFSKAAWAKIAGLIFSSPLGIIYFFVIIGTMLVYAYTIVKAMVIYLMAMLAVALLLILAPVFISCILFDKTKGFFDAWLKNLINYTLQPVFVFTTLAIFNVFVFAFFHQILFYQVCWDSIFSIHIKMPIILDIDIEFLKFWVDKGTGSIANINNDWAKDHLPSMPMSFAMLVTFILVVSAMLKFVDWMSELAAQITTAMRNNNVAQAAGKALNTAAIGGLAMAYGGIKGAKEGNKKGGTAGGISGAVKGARDGLNSTR